jgi:hypothetical protein
VAPDITVAVHVGDDTKSVAVDVAVKEAAIVQVFDCVEVHAQVAVEEGELCMCVFVAVAVLAGMDAVKVGVPVKTTKSVTV